MKIYTADIKVHVNYGVMASKKRLAEPVYKTLKNFIVSSLSLNDLNSKDFSNTHISRVYREIKLTPEQEKTSKREGRVRIVAIENVSQPLGLVK